MTRMKPVLLARRARSAVRDFLRDEAAGGVLLFAAAALALVLANSAAAPGYFAALDLKLGPLTLRHWINDGLMAVFFLLVGLEIKRETLDGQLRTRADRVLPSVAALGGMAVPAAIYLLIVRSSPELARGWAIPAATDIAFALGVMALLGRRVPVALKLLLTAIAILDDLGAILIIAVAYTDALNLSALAGAAVATAALAGLNRAGVVRLSPYLAVGAALWVCMLLSGIHATLAGVITALAVPLRPSPGRPEPGDSALHQLEHALSPWVAFAVVPIFGLANAGLALGGVTPAALAAPLPLGIAVALVIGKPVGVVGAVAIARWLGLAKKPPGVGMRQFTGMAALCGIGFTMSLFISGLAFGESGAAADAAKLGILVGSALAAVVGSALLVSGASKPE